eukprot:403340866
MKNNKKLSARRFPERSPTSVLTTPQAAQLRSSDGIRCTWLSMADSDSPCSISLYIPMTEKYQTY